jgi:hypothetical protein
MLDSFATEHPLKHQDAYARRYILQTKTGKRLEMMFEQSETSPANIWISSHIASGPALSKIGQKLSPASKLYRNAGTTGNLNYGRHSALEKMPQLGNADLVCLQPQTLAEAGAILDHLLVV